MSTTVEPFKPWHAAEIAGADCPEDYADYLADVSTQAWTLRVDGKAVAIGGVAPSSRTRAMVWSFIDPAARAHPAILHRTTLRMLSLSTYRRLEMTVLAGFVRGCRWAEALGFVHEATLRAFDDDGRDHELYARVRP